MGLFVGSERLGYRRGIESVEQSRFSKRSNNVNDRLGRREQLQTVME